MEFLFFLLVAAISVASGVMMILMRNAMYSALFLVLNFFCLAVFYVLLNAHFLAVVQVAVYAGAIMVLMLFVIMLLNVSYPESRDRRMGIMKPFGILAALVLMVELAIVGAGFGRPVEPAEGTAGAPAAVVRTLPVAPITPAPAPAPVGDAEVGHTQLLASVLFSRYILPFEVTSILLLAAILGAAVLARKKPDVEQVGGVRVK
ncbi:MAG TPA: NADH-quinone oxidoreductase subunit J [Chloroflexota bacterium]|nr:NADH-quinone oxidoreductase subunit J [Chloroflexota bacterium]